MQRISARTTSAKVLPVDVSFPAVGFQPNSGSAGIAMSLVTLLVTAPQEDDLRKRGAAPSIQHRRTGVVHDGPQLLELYGSLNGQPVRFLVDSSASTNIVDQRLVKRHGWMAQRKPMPVGIQLANGQTQSSSSFVEPGLLSLGEYKDKERFHVTELGDHDVILGQSWLERVVPQIDWQCRTVTIRHGDKVVTLTASATG
jgi:predicted aspartyl protease